MHSKTNIAVESWFWAFAAAAALIVLLLFTSSCEQQSNAAQQSNSDEITSGEAQDLGLSFFESSIRIRELTIHGHRYILVRSLGPSGGLSICHAGDCPCQVTWSTNTLERTHNAIAR